MCLSLVGCAEAKEGYGFDLLKQGWFPQKYEVQEIEPDDEFNGIYNWACVRPRDISERNKYGYGFVEQYGTAFGGENYVNVVFKHCDISFYPEELEIIKPNSIPKWIRVKKYGWFYDDEGNKQSWYKDYWETGKDSK